MLMSQSFSMGDGNLNHNLRITRGRGVRQNGKPERRSFNEYIDVDMALVNECKRNKSLNYEREAIKAALAPLAMDALNAYNERQLRTRHSNRMMTMDEWIDKRAVAQRAKKKEKRRGNDSVFSEYIVQIGDKTTGSTFEYETDEDGKPIDKDGQIISVWRTDKALLYKDNKVVKKNEHIPLVYRKFYERFKEANPNFLSLGAFIHGDETAGWHMHISGLWISKSKEGIGIGLGETSGMREQYRNRGVIVNNKRTDNVMTKWQAEMRVLLESVCRDAGIEKLDMECKREHERNGEFQRNQDRRAKAMAEMEEEIVRHIDEREAALAVRESETKKREAETKKREAMLKEKETVLKEKETALSEREVALSKQEAVLKEKEQNIINSAEVKPFLIHHYNVLKEYFPDAFRTVHKKVVELYGGKKKNGTVKKNELER